MMPLSFVVVMLSVEAPRRIDALGGGSTEIHRLPAENGCSQWRLRGVPLTLLREWMLSVKTPRRFMGSWWRFHGDP